jgi:hypothetical protein
MNDFSTFRIVALTGCGFEPSSIQTTPGERRWPTTFAAFAGAAARAPAARHAANMPVAYFGLRIV